MSRFVFLLISAALVMPVHAGLFDDEEARRQIRELRAELNQTSEALTRRVDGANQNQLDFSNQAEALRASVARLTGQIEVLTNSLDAAHKRQQDFYVDLDNRLRKLEASSTTSSAAPNPPEVKADPQAEMRDYEAALGHFRNGKFKEAQASFESFIALHTKSALLPNANYWLGSSFYQQKQYGKAATIFAQVAATWPTDPKTPDALLAQANALIEVKDDKAAVAVLEALVDKYPSSLAAETARTRLKILAPKKRR
ncbi:MAG: tol-pal system protein YbgF [Gammaproteobacteria bacterium]|nr:tol-pal system protein YbgF [Rhodocyclaceae bacterium]MBU3910679.1 tol-pal system protein YbgF [Gammaproteobacteria bacterium]MBU3989923.1 tol-pal system protein YbgF [Gammaproteobacteria bacterium]MBU4003388.1 tol-pal system protein YbgF [Gammaproteobacteria bacterium]MBU4021859.1 tol-pal system protein YbgF [Gammaproteobacteria bacterium]